MYRIHQNLGLQCLENRDSFIRWWSDKGGSAPVITTKQPPGIENPSKTPFRLYEVRSTAPFYSVLPITKNIEGTVAASLENNA